MLIIVATLAGAWMAAWLMVAFNSLLRLSNRADRAWGQMDELLRHRCDIAARLLELVGGRDPRGAAATQRLALAHERAADACTPAEHARAEPPLREEWRALLALAESRPECCDGEELRVLRNHSAEVESRLQPARQDYNEAARALNAALGGFPHNLAAMLAGIGPRELFQPASPAPGDRTASSQPLTL
jgi:LemA protein